MRPSWDEFFMRKALLTSERATCSRLKVGAVIVQGKHEIASGYNGSASGEVHCIDEGCLMRDNHCIRTIHAEQNALLQCSKLGVSSQGASVYCTHFPCLHCTKSLVTAGIKEVVYLNDYKNDEYAIHLLTQAGVNIRKVEL
ncbi:deoxycytidylate deaminase [Bacillus phage vB_BpsS-36]|uniref:Deoxycytidylate deaminase n=1 Tax=Bacillus phage vB_BpsS-36 TaxID=2419622 RepID=A0A3G3BX90_9CAUD|nr:deoxycytidylate deaminase [Bacillus phage vB_BpsS-36]